ncbi:MAG: primosomal protein N' [Holosporaceae bacterium]|jgi:primosomal protein N' (replication factor Y)|nr:primosomal protein N' [Holosporaceae bacterium]
MKVFSVLPVGPFDNGYSYYSDTDLSVGDILEVPFGRRSVIGVVLDEEETTSRKLKEACQPVKFNIGRSNCDFLKWVADYTLIPCGNVLKMMLSEKSVFASPSRKMDDAIFSSPFPKIVLNQDQVLARQKIIENAEKPFLLHGVTGSGKTEIYLSMIQDILKQQRQALVLFPEIALTQQIVKRVEKYFGIGPLIWNSQVTPKNRRTAWFKAISGSPCIVIGARSALFIPFTNLGIIVVDEEHDSSYKQEDGGFYSARDMSIVRGHLQQIPVILSSATPSLESYVNAQRGKYGYALVKNRFGQSQMPLIDLIDMRQNKFDGFISPPLLDKIRSTLANGEQCLIYLNRRGYAPVVLCKSCGEKIACPNCTAWLTYHKGMDKLICHHCCHKINMPNQCRGCGGEGSLIPFGPGIERIFEELQRKIPAARIEAASSDTISSWKSIEKLFDKITSGNVDIVIGTQILAKGHHFPNITMVGMVDGDLGLSSTDLRVSEKTYQLINQVAGRAGRAEKPGHIYIQTFNPNHSIYSALKSENSNDFFRMEIESRRKDDWPPFSRLASIIISGTNRTLTEQIAKNLYKTRPPWIQVFGPAPAPIFLLRGRTRWRFLLRSPENKLLNSAIKRWISSSKVPKNIKIQVDIDPISFL